MSMGWKMSVATVGLIMLLVSSPSALAAHGGTDFSATAGQPAGEVVGSAGLAGHASGPSGITARTTAQPGPTLVVDDDRSQCPNAGYTNISNAVAAAPSGAIVRVCAGQYTDQITIDKPLTLRAANRAQTSPGAAGNAILDGSNTLATAVRIEHSGVTIDGFEITGYTDNGIFTPRFVNAPRGNVVPTRVANVAVEHNYIHDLGPTALLIRAGSGDDRENWVIRNNTIAGAEVTFIGGAGRLYFENNTLNDSRIEPSASGSQSFTTVRVTGNKMTNGGGVTLSASAEAQLTDVVIARNNISSDAGPTSGVIPIVMDLGCGRVSLGCNATIHDVTIQNNTISTSEAEAIATGVPTIPETTTIADVQITKNRISAGASGAAVFVSANTSASTFEIHRNDLLNARFGVNNENQTAGAIVNATNNWWGTDDGPSSNGTSAERQAAPFADPVTGELADGSGTGVSLGTNGNSNVHFDPISRTPFTSLPTIPGEDPPIGIEIVTVSLQPRNVSVAPNSMVQIDVIADGIDSGVGSYKLQVNSTNISRAKIAAGGVENQIGGGSQVDRARNGSSVEVGAFAGDTNDTGPASIATLTVAAGAPGQVNLTLAVDTLSNETGGRYTVAATSNATLTVAQPAPDVTGDGRPATDPDNDGLYEDVNGDGIMAPGDATVLFNAVFSEDPAVTENVALFDFNNDGIIAPGDATVLFNEVFA